VSDLGAFGGGDPDRVRSDDGNAHDRQPSVKVTGAKGPVVRHQQNICGYIGKDSLRGWCFVSRKVRETHYYRVGEGYAMSCAVIGKLQYHDVEFVVFWESDEHRTLVFRLDQYASGDDVAHAPNDDPQQYVPESAALEVWENVPDPKVDIRGRI
jgi:hypothetical protein